jgi:hypothetical protein
VATTHTQNFIWSAARRERDNKSVAKPLALQNGEIIKGIILKQNEVAGIISGKEEFKEEKADINDMPGKI